MKEEISFKIKENMNRDRAEAEYMQKVLKPYVIALKPSADRKINRRNIL